MLDCRKKANEKWVKENYEQVIFRVPKGEKAQLKQWADASGVSMAQYIRQACAEKAERIVK